MKTLHEPKRIAAVRSVALYCISMKISEFVDVGYVLFAEFSLEL